jgi:hypothetical protein
MAEIDVVRPFLKNRITPVNGLPTDKPFPVPGATIIIPSADLSWTVSPRFEVGYRLPDSTGYWALGYQFLNSEGTATKLLGVPGVPFADRTRVNLNEAHLDYGTSPYEFAPHWDFSWRIGIQFDDIFFDSRVVHGDTFEQASNLFYGAGPHGRLDLERWLSFLPGLAVFGRLDGAVMVGTIHQHFRASPGVPEPALTLQDQIISRTQAVPTLNVQAGLSYTPPMFRNVHISTGYTFEYFWYLGQLGINPDGSFANSRGELGSQGWFLRAQIDF